MVNKFFALFKTNLYVRIWKIFSSTWPIWLPISLIALFFSTWLSYKRREWIKSQGSVLLEIKIPKDIQKSPAAMEVILGGLFEPVVGNFTDVYLNGRVRDWFSLEIASIGGEVRFFIWAFPKWKSIIQSRIYAQYPNVEISEVEDYTRGVVYDPAKNNLFGVTTALVKPDAYPIKTYIDYGLDKPTAEPEEIVDPLVPLIEYLGSLKPGEQAWIQILIQAHRKEGFQDAKIFFRRPDWKKGVEKEIAEIIKKGSIKAGDNDKPSTVLNLSKGQQETIAAIERNMSKLAFDTMIRILYIAPLEVYDRTRGLGLLGSLRQFGSATLNGIKPNKFMGVDFPWSDFRNRKERYLKRTHLEAYKRRSFFNVPFKNLNGRPYVLTTEELATIFHFPGAAAATPTLTRIPSKKAEAPSNLPV